MFHFLCGFFLVIWFDFSSSYQLLRRQLLSGSKSSPLKIMTSKKKYREISLGRKKKYLSKKKIFYCTVKKYLLKKKILIMMAFLMRSLRKSREREKKIICV